MGHFFKRRHHHFQGPIILGTVSILVFAGCIKGHGWIVFQFPLIPLGRNSHHRSRVVRQDRLRSQPLLVASTHMVREGTHWSSAHQREKNEILDARSIWYIHKDCNIETYLSQKIKIYIYTYMKLYIISAQTMCACAHGCESKSWKHVRL